jgi:hypothetical protein
MTALRRRDGIVDGAPQFVVMVEHRWLEGTVLAFGRWSDPGAASQHPRRE